MVTLSEENFKGITFTETHKLNPIMKEYFILNTIPRFKISDILEISNC